MIETTILVIYQQERPSASIDAHSLKFHLEFTEDLKSAELLSCKKADNMRKQTTRQLFCLRNN